LVLYWEVQVSVYTAYSFEVFEEGGKCGEFIGQN
jgi:hypothetical protein